MLTVSRIIEIHKESMTAGAGKLTGREGAFLASVALIAQRPGFTGLSVKQETWFCAIAERLEASKGKSAVQIIGEKYQRRFRHYEDSYGVACAGR